MISIKFIKICLEVLTIKKYFKIDDDLKKYFFLKLKLDILKIIKQSDLCIVFGMNDLKYLPSKEIYTIEKNIEKTVIFRNIKKMINNSNDILNVSSGLFFSELLDVARYVRNRYGVR